MGWMDQLKKAGMSMVYGYLDQDPDRNLPKLIDWADQLDTKNVYGPARKQFRKVIEDPESNWYQLIKSLWTDIDDGVRRTLFENFIVNASLLGYPKQIQNSEKYGCNIPWAILLQPPLYRLLGGGVRQSNEYGPGDAGFHRKAGYGVGHLYVPLHRGRASGAEEGPHHAV